MKTKRILIVGLIALFQPVKAQTPDEIYRKPLMEVLLDIQDRYKVTLQYRENIVMDLTVSYPTWRYRTDIEQTLDNILLPLDLVYEKTGDKIYRIDKFAYYKRTVEEGKKYLNQLLDVYPTLQLWETRKSELRKCILEQLRLNPFPKNTPFHPVTTSQRKYDGYTVENVAIETIPGVYLCGSVYRPSKGKGPFPLVLCPYGHFSDPDTNLYGRYRPDMQYRCATLARMGAVVFSYDMFAWGESRLQFDNAIHRTGLAQTVQSLNSIRAIDYLTSLKYVDAKRIGITGASSGGSQSFMTTALDDRITVSVPVVMVSSYFYGGCPCESGMPVQTCGDPPTYNVEIAAMASPRPMLVVSDGDDWTENVPEVEFPYLQKVYGLYGKQNLVKNVHLANEKHDYGISKRLAMYEFMALHLGLNISDVKDKEGKIDESKVTIEKYDKLLVFGKNGKMPANALHDAEQVWDAIRRIQ
jgi:dienelactone hydrolase